MLRKEWYMLPITYNPPVLLAYLLVSFVVGVGWTLGCWVVGRILR